MHTQNVDGAAAAVVFWALIMVMILIGQQDQSHHTHKQRWMSSSQEAKGFNARKTFFFSFRQEKNHGNSQSFTPASNTHTQTNLRNQIRSHLQAHDRWTDARRESVLNFRGKKRLNMKKQKKSRTNNYQLDFDYCVQSLKREQDKRTKERHTQLTQLSNYALFVVCVCASSSSNLPLRIHNTSDCNSLCLSRVNLCEQHQ